MSTKSPIEECVEWLGSMIESGKFDEGEVNNMIKFKAVLSSGALDNHKGRYVYVSRGQLHSQSYKNPDSFFSDEQCDMSDQDALLFHVPDATFRTAQVKCSVHRGTESEGVVVPVTFNISGHTKEYHALVDTGATYTECPNQLRLSRTSRQDDPEDKTKEDVTTTWKHDAFTEDSALPYLNCPAVLALQMVIRTALSFTSRLGRQS